ncbi:MAG: hypothetical protein Tp1100MES1331091_8 [Prokaryotic dsDNA virus sp.]|nr:MAG: hypothetical protein Tp1100MES1331091_8 [Prokaryotic dsDNA virus sp.]
MKRSTVNKLRGMNSRRVKRYYQWFTEGKKDGMCGIYRDLSAVPKLYREAYNAGHAYGALSREAAYYA